MDAVDEAQSQDNTFRSSLKGGPFTVSAGATNTQNPLQQALQKLLTQQQGSGNTTSNPPPTSSNLQTDVLGGSLGSLLGGGRVRLEARTAGVAASGEPIPHGGSRAPLTAGGTSSFAGQTPASGGSGTSSFASGNTTSTESSTSTGPTPAPETSMPTTQYRDTGGRAPSSAPQTPMGQAYHNWQEPGVLPPPSTPPGGGGPMGSAQLNAIVGAYQATHPGSNAQQALAAAGIGNVMATGGQAGNSTRAAQHEHRSAQPPLRGSKRRLNRAKFRSERIANSSKPGGEANHANHAVHPPQPTRAPPAPPHGNSASLRHANHAKPRLTGTGMTQQGVGGLREDSGVSREQL